MLTHTLFRVRFGVIFATKIFGPYGLLKIVAPAESLNVLLPRIKNICYAHMYSSAYQSTPSTPFENIFVLPPLYHLSLPCVCEIFPLPVCDNHKQTLKLT